jgi:hypothetical protein
MSWDQHQQGVRESREDVLVGGEHQRFLTLVGTRRHPDRPVHAPAQPQHLGLLAHAGREPDIELETPGHRHAISQRTQFDETLAVFRGLHRDTADPLQRFPGQVAEPAVSAGRACG